MFYKDLEVYITYFGDIEEDVFNIRWLDVVYEFNQGDVSQKLKDKLLYLTLFQETSQKPRRKENIYCPFIPILLGACLLGVRFVKKKYG